ncbi:MAG: clostripain-related cysteine peptidase [Caldisericia bacterium]|jgi:hypothetical protein|nr:clostripain-related cysteine peptidase [Caldisericia bacterium]
MSSKKFLILIFLLIITFSIIGCKRNVTNPVGVQTEPIANWTLLFYMGGTNNLEDLMFYNINQLEKIGSNPKFNILVQFSKLSENGKATRYYITQDNDMEKINSKPIEIGEVDSADYRVLKDFIIWGIKNYPSNQYALIISSHGGGWTGIIEDEIHKSFMSAIDLQKALREARFETGRKFDVIHIYSCLMGMTEILYQLRDEANFIIASEISQYVFINLDKAIKPLSEFPGVTPKDFAISLVKNFIEGWKNPPFGLESKPQIYTAFNMLEIKNLKDTIDRLSTAILRNFLFYGDYIIEDILSVPPIEKEGLYSTYLDLKYVLETLNKDIRITSYEIKSSINEVLNVLNRFILYKEISPGYVHKDPKLLNLQDASGLSIWLPIQKFSTQFVIDYSKLDFSVDTAWLPVLHNLNPNLPRFLQKARFRNWALYSDDEFSFEFKYPNDEDFKPIKEGNFIYIFGGEFVGFSGERRYFGGDAYMFIEIQKNLAENDIELWAKREIAKIVPLYVEYKDVHKEVTEINGQKAFISISSGIDRVGEKITEAHFYFLSDRTGYNLTYIADSALFPEFIDIFISIAKSFKIY